MSISITLTDEFDIPKILEIQLEGNLSSWTTKDYLIEIKKRNAIFLACKIENETVGFLASRFVIINENAGEPIKYAELDILNFGVLKKFQGKGIGSLLFENLLNRFTVIPLETIWLEVRESNLNAISFYKKRGFTAIQNRKNFYRQPTENAVVMKFERRTSNRKISNKT